MFRLPCCGCRLRWQLWRVAWPKRMSLFMGLRSKECQHGRIFQKRQQSSNFSGCCGTGRRESSISAAFPAKAQVRVHCGLHWCDPSPIHAECVHNLHVESFHAKGKWPANVKGNQVSIRWSFKPLCSEACRGIRSKLPSLPPANCLSNSAGRKVDE